MWPSSASRHLAYCIFARSVAPEVTVRVCSGWVCRAVRAPGSNVTLPAPARDETIEQRIDACGASEPVGRAFAGGRATNLDNVRDDSLGRRRRSLSGALDARRKLPARAMAVCHHRANSAGPGRACCHSRRKRRQDCPRARGSKGRPARHPGTDLASVRLVGRQAIFSLCAKSRS